MFAKLLSRLVPLPASAHDHLFTTFAPEGAPPQVLNTIYHQYRDAMPDEAVPPQHMHYRGLVDRIIGANWRRLDGIELRRVGSAYVTCFERSEAFEFQLALWRADPDFRRMLMDARERLIAELMPLAAAEKQFRFYVPESQAPVMERALIDARAAEAAFAVFAIDQEGEARVRELRLNGRSYASLPGSSSSLGS